jgi:hypothetical protein
VDTLKFPGSQQGTRVLVQASELEIWSAGEEESCVYMWNANGQCTKKIIPPASGEVLQILPLRSHVWIASTTGISVYDKMVSVDCL